jgi:hypothetical protein
MDICHEKGVDRQISGWIDLLDDLARQSARFYISLIFVGIFGSKTRKKYVSQKHKYG